MCNMYCSCWHEVTRRVSVLAFQAAVLGPDGTKVCRVAGVGAGRSMLRCRPPAQP